MDAYRAAIERFRTAAAADELVLAAFLGGSYAAGRATETSDLDVYVITRRENYEASSSRCSRRRRFYDPLRSSPSGSAAQSISSKRPCRPSPVGDCTRKPAAALPAPGNVK